MPPLIFIIIVFIIWYHCNVHRFIYAKRLERVVASLGRVNRWGMFTLRYHDSIPLSLCHSIFNVVERESLLRNSLICRSAIQVHSLLQPIHTNDGSNENTVFVIAHIILVDDCFAPPFNYRTLWSEL